MAPSTPSSASGSRKPSRSAQPSSLRRTVHRKRSSSSDIEIIEPSTHASSSSSKKSRSERPGPSTPSGGGNGGGPSKSLLSKAINNTIRQGSPAAPTLPAAPAAAVPAETLTPNARAQFEGQVDFIGFDFDDEEDEPSSRRGTPAGRGGKRGTPASGKRKLDEFEERAEEGSRNLQKRERERSTPWCDEPGVEWDKCENAINMLNREAKAFVTYISPTPVEHELRLWTIELIRRTIKRTWSDADVQCFGSVGTGLYLPGGDIDLVVLCPTMPSPPLKPSSSLLHRLASLLLTSSLAEPSSLVVIAKARVPIVKFVTRYGGFSVDMSVNQKNGVDAAVRVRGLLEDFAFRTSEWVEPGANDSKGSGKGKGKAVEPVAAPSPDDLDVVDHGVARALVLLVKAFLNQRGMNEVFTGGLGSYSIICLVVSFLQLHPKIQTGEIHPAYNVGLLFVEFLEYYGKHFNFDEAGITLRGKGGYFNKHDKGWWRPNQPYLLSIEDPNDPTNDVSGGSHNIIRVRQTLAGAFDVLQATLLHRASHFAAQDDDQRLPLDGSLLPNADPDAPSALSQSVLGAVVGMSRAGIRAREENIRLYNDGVLQSLLEKSRDGTELGGTSKKALKRLRKEEMEKKKRDRTIAKLEQRQEEREAKQERKHKKKRDLEATLAPKVGSTTSSGVSTPVFGTEDFIIDTVGTAPRPLPDDEDESRYSIASPGPGTLNAKLSAAAHRKQANEALYVGGSDSDFSSGEESQHDDGDVFIGGGAGDVLAGSATKKRRIDDGGSSRGAGSSSDDSDEMVVQTLRVNGAAAKAKADNKKAAKASFWAAKGPVEATGNWDD